MIRLRSTVVWIGALTTMSALSGCVTLGIGQTGATAGAPTAVTTSAASSTSAAAPSSRPSDPTTNPPRGTGVSNSPTTSKIAPPPPDNATPPGTELKIGQPAISSYDSLGQVNNVEVTIVSITKGKQADLVNFDIKDAALKLATPFYVVSQYKLCLLYTSPSPRDRTRSRMPSSA